MRAQEGDLDAVIEHGVRALQGKRKSLPTLLMASRDLTKILNDRYSAESKTRNYLDQVNAYRLNSPAALGLQVAGVLFVPGKFS